MFIGLCLLGIPQQPGTGQIVRLIAFPTGYFVFKNENVKVKVKYSFVLRTGLAGSHLVWAYYSLCSFTLIVLKMISLHSPAGTYIKHICPAVASNVHF
jgi:hypothetical protein